MKLNRETGELIYNDKVYELDDIDPTPMLNIDIQELMTMTFSPENFIDDLIIQTHSPDGFGTYLFHELEFYKSDNKIEIVFLCRQPNKYWEGQYGLSTFLVALADVVKDSIHFNFNPDSLEIDDDWKNLEVFIQIEKEFQFGDIITQYSNILKDLINQTERILSGAAWRKEYETDEKLFCTEIIFPLLRKMDFIDVRFNHGVREYGKDFTFSELTKFGNLRHYAIQAKAGNLRGNVNAEIDEIIGQLNDAFAMPYYEVSANETRNISTFIIAISGHFTENAKDKIIQKIPQHFKGCIYLVDRDKILELIERYWK
ncbi:MAG: restriction endonuclease [Bacteroidia bacterium]|nr:restriction endonuclease [Bacteroidia bacterium]